MIQTQKLQITRCVQEYASFPLPHIKNIVLSQYSFKVINKLWIDSFFLNTTLHSHYSIMTIWFRDDPFIISLLNTYLKFMIDTLHRTLLRCAMYTFYLLNKRWPSISQLSSYQLPVELSTNMIGDSRSTFKDTYWKVPNHKFFPCLYI